MEGKESRGQEDDPHGITFEYLLAFSFGASRRPYEREDTAAESSGDKLGLVHEQVVSELYKPLKRKQASESHG